MNENFKIAFINIYWYICIIGPWLSYYPQYKLMEKNQSVGSFTPYICYISYFASLLKIIFFFGHSYDWCILAESISMIIIQFILLKKYYDLGYKLKLRRFNPILEFSLISSIFFLVYLVVFKYIKNSYFVEFTGSLASCIEVLLPLFQFKSNYEKKSVESISFFMIFFWLFLDSIEIIFLTFEHQPTNFLICSMFQICFDSLIVVQLVFYEKKGKSLERELQNSICVEIEANTVLEISAGVSTQVTEEIKSISRGSYE